MRRAIVVFLVTAGAPVGAAVGISACGSSEPSAPPASGAAQPELGSVEEPAILARKNCKLAITDLLSGAITPPSIMAGIDMAGLDAGADGALTGGGTTFAQTGLAACAQYTEPQKTVNPLFPGYRESGFTHALDASADALDPSDPITFAYNEQSKVLAEIVMSGSQITSTLSFHSRKAGAYGSGHHYVISFADNADASAGSVTKDGVDFPADWSEPLNEGGTAYEASPWANEIYDGILATFAPTFPAASTGDCLSTTFEDDLSGLAQPTPECLYYPEPEVGPVSYLGVRPLGFYMVFDHSTNHLKTMYTFWKGGVPSCSTPSAAVESMDWGGVDFAAAYNESSGYSWSIGNLPPGLAVSNAKGLTLAEANDLVGCGGVTATAPDTGYEATSWGASGEILMEYKKKGQVAYKVFGVAGYKGTLSLTSAPLSDGGVDNYVLGIGAVTLNGAPYTIDWSTMATATSSISPIVNALVYYETGIVKKDTCVKSGDCSIVLDDGAGHSTFTVSLTEFGLSEPLTWVFPKGTSAPVQVYTVNSGGM